MKRPQTVLITTTINVPTVLTQWAGGLKSDDWIIVAGDKKSPHAEITSLLKKIEKEHVGVQTLYLHPDLQTKWKCSEVIGWNSIQRRNIALLEAIALQPTFIITVDDDNAPMEPDQVHEMIRMMTTHHDKRFITTPTGWYNPGRVCITDNDTDVIHRGWPMDRRNEEPRVIDVAECNIGVGAMLWTGDPDIDAVDRIVKQQYVIGVARIKNVLTPGTWAPFNSQATMYLASLAPLMMVWPGVGRYDDIWASYLARRVMDHFQYGVYYGYPTVHQARNDHDLTKDVAQEIFGMRHTPELVKILREITFDDRHNTIVNAMMHVHDTLHNVHFINETTRVMFYAWMDDVNNALTQGVKWES